jgi:hypothetical protein
MCLADLAPRFDASIVFPDIDAATLARENEKSIAAKEPEQSAWQSYMRKVLPPVPQHRAQAALRLVHL